MNDDDGSGKHAHDNDGLDELARRGVLSRQLLVQGHSLFVVHSQLKEYEVYHSCRENKVSQQLQQCACTHEQCWQQKRKGYEKQDVVEIIFCA